ncbi:MAG: hypothetical protein AAF845_02155 [Bacteroidota bacterium]
MGLFSRADPPTHFPEVRGRRLDGTDLTLPGDLPADATLLVVSFRDDLDPLADQWARLGDRLAAAHGERFAVWEVPVVNKALKFLGELGTVGIRGQIGDERERERTVPIFAEPKAFRKALEIPSASGVYPVLVTRDGRIAWRGDGEIGIEEVEGLEAAVQGLLGPPLPATSEDPGPEAS